MSIAKRLLLLLSMMTLSMVSLAAIDIYEFDTESQRQRYHVLVDELRCPKCQNQNLSGSNSQIATDLRRELHRLLLEGKTDAEIKAFMVARYGDFVLYSPPIKASTASLWILPILLLVVGLVVLVLIVRQRRQIKDAVETVLSEDDVSKLNTLLDDVDKRS